MRCMLGKPDYTELPLVDKLKPDYSVSSHFPVQSTCKLLTQSNESLCHAFLHCSVSFITQKQRQQKKGCKCTSEYKNNLLFCKGLPH